ncbi:hypothetical protein QR680_002676 [Steinernema hermaphroditum]|uniref:Uncharacterized protein n=1 Tax=Steinernema hermaphroditum TaxID=289476 RepID=A0AA39H5R4_9BILA|nr:hypothetical protein QR680_002676 [Steinernema hermaphroditum]
MAFTYQNPLLLQNPMRSLNPPKNFEVLSLNLNVNLETLASLNRNASFLDANGHSRLLGKPSISSFKDISLIAFLPVCVLACLFAFAFIVVRVRSWRQERTQLRHLERVYDILECVCDAPKPTMRSTRSSGDLHIPIPKAIERLERSEVICAMPDDDMQELQDALEKMLVAVEQRRKKMGYFVRDNCYKHLRPIYTLRNSGANEMAVREHDSIRREEQKEALQDSDDNDEAIHATDVPQRFWKFSKECRDKVDDAALKEAYDLIVAPWKDDVLQPHFILDKPVYRYADKLDYVVETPEVYLRRERMERRERRRNEKRMRCSDASDEPSTSQRCRSKRRKVAESSSESNRNDSDTGDSHSAQSSTSTPATARNGYRGRSRPKTCKSHQNASYSDEDGDDEGDGEDEEGIEEEEVGEEEMEDEGDQEDEDEEEGEEDEEEAREEDEEENEEEEPEKKLGKHERGQKKTSEEQYEDGGEDEKEMERSESRSSYVDDDEYASTSDCSICRMEAKAEEMSPEKALRYKKAMKRLNKLKKSLDFYHERSTVKLDVHPEIHETDNISHLMEQEMKRTVTCVPLMQMIADHTYAHVEAEHHIQMRNEALRECEERIFKYYDHLYGNTAKIRELKDSEIAECKRLMQEYKELEEEFYAENSEECESSDGSEGGEDEEEEEEEGEEDEDEDEEEDEVSDESD